MLSRINKLLFGILIVAVSLYIAMMNRETAHFYLLDSLQFTTSLGVIALGVFCAGLLTASLLTVSLGIRAYFRERAFKSREVQRDSFFSSLTDARTALAIGNVDRAEVLWRQIIRKDPANVLARVELSKVLEEAGDSREALRVIEEARSHFPENGEVLFRAALLNQKLGNNTAAIDNLNLIIANNPSKKTIRLALALSEDLGRIEDAEEYISQLQNLGDDVTDELSRIQFAKMQREQSTKSAMQKFTELTAFSKRNPQFVPALRALGNAAWECERADDAIQALLKAGKISGELEFYNQAIEYWLERKIPEKAIAVAKSARNDALPEKRVTAELQLAKLYLQLNMLDEAHASIQEIKKAWAKDKEPSLRAAEISQIEGIYFALRGEYKQAADLWKTIWSTTVPEIKRTRNYGGEAPSPILSTP